MLVQIGLCRSETTLLVFSCRGSNAICLCQYLDTFVSVVKYIVQVYTGDVKKAGTDANVSITIYGERGDTGSRKLIKSNTNLNKWEGGQVDNYLN